MTCQLPSDPHAVYRVFANDGRLLYVGCSIDVLSRVKNHEKNRPWSLEISSVSVEWHKDRDTALVAEKAAIASELPEWNVHHRPTPQHAIGRMMPTYDPRDPATWVRSRSRRSPDPRQSSVNGGV
jgi:predicted GIY-YIG superfamily endonuclease